MSGDIHFKISKKSIGLITAVLGAFTYANYVSLVDVKNAGGIVIEKETMNVGSVVLRMDNMNPADIYGGTWQLIEDDATLAFGDGSNLSGVAIGDNDPQVPLVEHSHDRGTMEIYGQVSAPGYGDTSVGYSLTGNGAFAPYGGKTVLDKIDGGANQGSIYRAVDFRASRNWTGNTSVEGVKNATLDVRGKRIKINVWQRIN